jgi:N-acetylmuramoyl-L-alanine amidase CwlA|nr:MAG TPA: N-acetylmuramoyl-L-alanine amidase [Caudoviricetes sp.]
MVQKPEMIEKFMKINRYGRPGTKRRRTTKIAFHFTGQHDVSAKNTVSYFSNVVANGYRVNGRYIYASSHLVIGLQGELYHIVPFNEIAYTTNSANAYSIGVECATTGADDHYTDEEYKTMVKTGAWLAQTYKLDPRVDFIRHYDVTGKICPRYFVNNVKAWKQFKLDCYNYMIGKLKESNIRNCTNGKGNSIIENEKVVDKTIEDKKAYNVQARVINCTTLNVRDTRPDKNGNLGKVKFVLKKGEIVTIGYSLNGWVSVYTNTDYGFVNKKYLEII